MSHYTEGRCVLVSSFKEFPRFGLLRLPKMLHEILLIHYNYINHIKWVLHDIKKFEGQDGRMKRTGLG